MGQSKNVNARNPHYYFLDLAYICLYRTGHLPGAPNNLRTDSVVSEGGLKIRVSEKSADENLT
jgi:hypothetical protein